MANIKDYELLQQIGSGTFAVVHKAINKKTRQFCAIKIMDRKKFSKTNYIDNLIQEISFHKMLDHRYIVKMYDFSWDATNIYIMMELCEFSLSSFIKKRNRLPESTVRIFTRMVAEALKYLRENNISHFDLKPQNLLLTRNNPNSIYVLKLCDFGFAQHLSSDEEESSMVKGSYLYMAPEIAINRKYDARADLYSIGVILYECLFGNAPYSSKTIDELLEKIKSRQKIELSSNVKISNECEDLLTRLLQHDPDKRISFQEFFNHSFVDMKHAPSDENMEKAIEIFRHAVEEDTNQNYNEAYHLYCEGLTYFVPSINAEVGARKVALREKAANYLNRAEEIKQFIIYSSSAPNVNVMEPVTKASSSSTQSVQNALEPTASYKALYEKCYSNDQLKNGLEIGKSGEYYAYEHKLENALENFKRALTILVPLLNKETDSERKKLLHKQIQEWMKEAESIKSILETQRNIEQSSSDSNTNSHCVIS
ncbi:unnamed protein product [Chironomus riparius]|uniref:Serine/threonine-protein kinase ULK3 n=1 Tax=Chironomus riparius TaxID=315576 RepID=A0A9N9WXZ8_9DIPT|nr:unnamed protein product [Chironomus riparius]